MVTVPCPRKSAPWSLGRRHGWTSSGAGRPLWGHCGEWKALLWLQTLPSFSRRGPGPAVPARGAPPASRAELGASSGLESAVAPRLPRLPADGGESGLKLVEPVALWSLSACTQPVGPEGAFLRQQRLLAGGWGKGRGAPQRGSGGQRTPPYKLERARNSDGPLRRPPEMRAAPCRLGLGRGGERSIGVTLGR